MDNKLQYTLSLKDLFTKQMGNAIGATEKLDSKMSSLKSGLAKIGLAVGIKELAKGILETGASFEMAEMQLKTLLGNADRAMGVFNDLRKEAESSPFSFETLLKGNAALISTGLSVRKAKEDFNSLANAISATGGGTDALERMVFNLQQIKNTGKATALDIKQFGYAGINIYGILNKYYEKNHIALKDQQNDYESITGALKLASEKGGQYFGALDNAVNSTSGRLVNLKDKFMNMQYMLFDKLKPAINSIVDSLSGLMTLIGNNITTIGLLIASYVAYRSILIATSAIQGGVALFSIISLSAGVQGLTTAQYALNFAMELCPVILLASTFLLLIKTVNDYKTVAQLTADGAQRSFNDGLKEEETLVSKLAKSYEKFGFSKEQAMKKAIASERQTLLSDIGDVKNQLSKGGLSESELSVANLKRKGFEGRLQALNEMSKNGISNIAEETTKAEKTKTNTGTEIRGNAPQNLYINIGKFVENFTVQTNNIQESGQRVKEIITQYMLEAANDVNMIAR